MRGRTPALFVGHGAAIFTTTPSDPTHQFLAGMAAEVAGWQPRAIVVISAHYAGDPLRVTGPGPLTTIHDHPVREVQGYRYPGHGDEWLTRRVHAALGGAGLEARVDETRGLDHGAWVPLSLLLPKGEIPVAQLSLAVGADASGPSDHVALGRVLGPLRNEGILLVGSGGITHDQGEFRRGYFGGRDVTVPAPVSRDFDGWVTKVVTTRRGEERAAALAAFERHPLAAAAHPTSEHFLPLLVIAGAAGKDAGRKRFEGFQHSLSTSAFQLGA